MYIDSTNDYFNTRERKIALLERFKMAGLLINQQIVVPFTQW